MASRPLDASAYQNHIWLNSKQTGDALAHDWVIIDGENPNLRDRATHDRSQIHALPASFCDSQERSVAVA